MRDQVREALFQRLGDVSDKVVLDLFAGSGSLGLEALSRGAARVTFVDRAKVCLSCVRRNVQAIGAEDRSSIRRHDLASGLSGLSDEGPFDLVLMDPPFPLLRSAPGPGEPDIRTLLREMGHGCATREGTEVAFESPSRAFRIDAELADMRLELVTRREYGSTALWILTALGSTP